MATVTSDSSCLAAEAEAVSAAPARRGGIGDVFALDLRSLALLRLMLATLLMVVFAQHAQSVLEPWWAASAGDASQVVASGSRTVLPWQAALLAAALAATLMLLIGYRSQWAAGACWAALVLLQWLAPATEPEDLILAMLLLWSVLLPLGARVSVDAAMARGSAQPNRFLSVASAALVLQVLAAYLLMPGAGLLSEAGGPGDATPLVSVAPLYLDRFAWLPMQLNHTIQVMVLLCLAAMLLPGLRGVPRLAATLVMIVLHVGLVLVIAVDLLPLVLAAMWAALLPARFWNLLRVGLHTPERDGLTLWYPRGDLAALRRARLLRTFLLLPETALRPTQEDVDIDVFRRQRDSWVVTDYRGYRYTRWRALAEAVSASPIAFPLAPLLRASPVETIGDYLYDLTRQRPGPLTRRLARVPAKPPTTPRRWPCELLAAIALLAVIAWRLWRCGMFT